MRPGRAAPGHLLLPSRLPGLARQRGPALGPPLPGRPPRCQLYHPSSPTEDVLRLLLPWMARMRSRTWTSSRLHHPPPMRSLLPRWGHRSFQTSSSCTCPRPRPRHSPWRRGLHSSLGPVFPGPRRRSCRLPQKSLLLSTRERHPQTSVASATRPCPPESWPWKP